MHTYIHTYNILSYYYTCACMHTIYTHTHTHIYIHPYYISTYLHTYMHTFIHTFIHTSYIHAYTHTYTHTNTHAHTRIHTFHTLAQTNTHTQQCSSVMFTSSYGSSTLIQAHHDTQLTDVTAQVRLHSLQ